MSNPYLDLDKTSFWKTGVAELSPFNIEKLWDPKFNIAPRHRIVTAGSCFAQHIGRALCAKGYEWMDAEPLPEFASAQTARTYNYGIFSFRTGNIYTTKMLYQWLSMAFGEEPQPDEYWQNNGRFYDPLRPTIEPEGFASLDELTRARETTFQAIRTAVQDGNIFIFTMGLTESWRARDTHLEYASCPGVSAGTYSDELHEFYNHDYSSVYKYMKKSLSILKRHQKQRLKVLLTVSPVPLTATASQKHVLFATSHSKSILRAVAAEFSSKSGNVDYFPSYEIITSAPYRGMFYDANQRSVLPQGVDFVMENFFADQLRTFGPQRQKRKKASKLQVEPEDDILCEEELLNAFAK